MTSLPSFNFFSLDYLYWPVSGIMWVWHKVFGSFMGAGNAWAWVLSVIFLVFTLRAILFKPFMKQMDSQLKMQAVQPRMKKLREKYKDDRQRLAEEMMKLNKEAGVSPIGGCLPALIQAPVFIGLFHVLRMFKPVPDGDGGWMFRDSVYFFGHEDVQNFGLAKLFGGAPLGGSMSENAGSLAYMDGVRETMIWVGVPLTILAGIATHLTSRRSVGRQRQLNPEAAAAPQAAIMNKLMMYVFPAFVVVSGPFFPLAILFYWLANNSWTFGQLFVAHRIQDKRKAAEAELVVEAKEATKFSTPRPGARPTPGAKPAPGARPAGGKPKPGAKPAPGGKPAAGAKPKPGANSGSNGAAGSSGGVSVTKGGAPTIGDGPSIGDGPRVGGPNLSKNGDNGSTDAASAGTASGAAEAGQGGSGDGTPRKRNSNSAKKRAKKKR